MRLALVLLLLPALAGCSAPAEVPTSEVKIRLSDVQPDDAFGRHLTCRSTGTFAVTHQASDKGDLTLTIHDGERRLVWRHVVKAGSADNAEDEVVGSPGTWVLKADRSLEFDAPFTATLRC